MDFKNYLEVNAQRIDQEVEKILIEFLEEVKKTNQRLTPFALGFINSCKGGKRIRGVLVKLGYEIANQSSVVSRQSSEILKVAAAFEILHAAILIHDDIMDQSPTRRGQASLYQALGGDHYGVSQALTLGDIGLFLAVKLITDTPFLGQHRLKALSYFSQMVINTGWGQVLDVELSQGMGKMLDDDIDFINLYKTAKYTIAGPFQIGAILGGADERLLEKLGKFGSSLGIAFQIRDDILDEEARLVDNAQIKALEYSLEAKNLIPVITKDNKMSKILEQMCEYLVERSK